MINLQDWQNLLTYYISCLEKEATSESTLDINSEGYTFETNFLHEESLFSSDKNEITIPLTDKINRLLKKTFYKGKSNKLFYSYPFVTFSDGEILPVFMIEVKHTIDEKNRTLALTSTNNYPEFNYAIFLKLGMVREEMYQKLHNIDSAQKDGFKGLLKIAFEQTVFEDKCNFDTNLLEKVDISISDKNSIHNQSLLFWGEAKGYTKKLVQELNELKQPYYFNQLENTSLKYLFEKIVDENNKKPCFIFSVLPLNTYQEDAIRNGLADNFTVITGPPGTGKSQVLVNLVINALIDDKSVLFASNNNKAVDVVYERLDKLTSDSYVIRTGNKAYRELASQKLTNIAEKIKYSKNDNKFIELKKSAIEAIESVDQILELIQKRKELNQKLIIIKKSVDSQEKACVWYKNNSDLKLIDQEQLNVLKIKFERLSKNTKTFLEIINDWLFSKKTKDRFINNFVNLLQENGYSFIEIKYFRQIEDVLAQLDNFKSYQENLHKLISINKELSKIPLQKTLQKQLAQKNKYLHEISLSLYENKWIYNLQTANSLQTIALQNFIRIQQRLNSSETLGGKFYQLIDQAMALITKVINIMPIWGVTNLAAYDSIPLSGGLFDLVVIDEASQCNIASSIPLLFRAKRLMIIGDVKQLTNISTITERQDKKYFDDSKSNLDYYDFSHVKQSLFKLVEKLYISNKRKPLMLKGHYRSHNEIISFSNNTFYDGQLEILTDTSKFAIENPGIYWLDVKGEGKRPGPGNIYNLEEATVVSKQMTDIIKQNGNKFSYGIISPFTKQASIIREKMAAILNEKTTPEAEKIDLTVGVAHIFQGDEKDIVIFSPVVTDNLPDSTVEFVNKEFNLLNVAVTRARQKLIIVGDLDFAQKKNGHLRSLANHVINLNHVISN